MSTAADRGTPPSGTASRGWNIGVVAGLAAWLGVTMFSMRWATPKDDSIVTRTFAVGGAVFFTAVFGISIWKIRSFHRSARVDLYERLAIAPVSRAVVRQSMRGVAQLSLIYIAFGAVVTALGLTAIYMGNDGQGPLLATMLAVVVVWAIVGLIAIARLLGPSPTGTTMMEPLGLQLVEVPSFAPSPVRGGLQTAGAMRFEGVRHGRRVWVTQLPDESETVVVGADDGRAPSAPMTATDMARLTGEGPRSWKRVTVEMMGRSVVVTRTGSGAAAWFLHDLVLAEAVAGRA